MGKEAHEHRLKRLRMRSWRRGTKEMDLILGPFADARLAELTPHIMNQYEALLEENDQDLYSWVTGQVSAPSDHVEVINLLRDFHAIA